MFTNSAYTFASIIKTPDEISIVVSYETEEKLDALEELGQAQESDGPWLALRVRGPMELSASLIDIDDKLLIRSNDWSDE
jgi:hypothetical protein